MTLIYRKPLTKDIKEIFEIGKVEFTWVFEKISWFESTVEWYVQKYSDYCFVAESQGVIVGFILVFYQDDFAYFGWGCSAQSHKNRGIMSDLTELAVNRVRENNNLKEIYSHVREDGIVNKMMKRRDFINIDQRKVEMKLSL